MAATLTANLLLNDVPRQIQTCDVSTLQLGADVSIPLVSRPAGLEPKEVYFTLLTPPTDGSLLQMSKITHSISGATVTVRWVGTGNPSGATGRVTIVYGAQGKGGIGGVA